MESKGAEAPPRDGGGEGRMSKHIGFLSSISFVKDNVPVGIWVYLWAFYLVPLVYIFIFASVSYCLDDL